MYEGVPLAELRVETVRWTRAAAEHIRTRRARYPDRVSEFDVEPEWATEAALDPDRLVATTGGASIEVIGRSGSAPPRTPNEKGRVLKVWLVPEDMDEGAWLGASACAANGKERRAYGDA